MGGGRAGDGAGERYRVGELARLCGVNPRTIDFYTNAGLLPPAARSAGGHRFYDAGAVRRLRTIKALRARGLHLAEIRGRLAAGGESEGLARVEQVRAELERLEGEVAALVVGAAGAAGAEGAEGRALRGAVAGAASFALALSQELMDLLAQLGSGPS